MNAYKIYPLSEDFTIRVNAQLSKPKLSTEEIHRIERIWHEEEQKKTILFNGQLLSFVSFDNQMLIGEFVEYKHYIAQARDHTLEAKLNIISICISGITLSGEKVLVGQRASNLANYPNCYELVPSGGIGGGGGGGGGGAGSGGVIKGEKSIDDGPLRGKVELLTFVSGRVVVVLMTLIRLEP